MVGIEFGIFRMESMWSSIELCTLPFLDGDERVKSKSLEKSGFPTFEIKETFRNRLVIWHRGLLIKETEVLWCSSLDPGHREKVEPMGVWGKFLEMQPLQKFSLT